ncbi:hypothetical protein PIB30_084909, partial [Stylosanthes scabra]|nr:hypothetical protein [Stylosanthes scabra]
ISHGGPIAVSESMVGRSCLKSIHVKHRKSLGNGDSSDVSRGLCGGVMDEYSMNRELIVLDVKAHT